jgi:hypothetical protein
LRLSTFKANQQPATAERPVKTSSAPPQSTSRELPHRQPPTRTTTETTRPEKAPPEQPRLDRPAESAHQSPRSREKEQSPPIYVTRSGRRSVPPQRLDM